MAVDRKEKCCGTCERCLQTLDTNPRKSGTGYSKAPPGMMPR